MHYWHYAESLNEQLGKTTQFIEPDEENYGTYSLEFTKIILSACSEIEVVSRLLCELIDPGCGFSLPGSRHMMKDIAQKIVKRFPNISTAKINIQSKDKAIYPFARWKNGKPDKLLWWEDYNAIKHHRYSAFHRATLKNAIDSVAALIIIDSYLYQMVGHKYPPRMAIAGLLDSNYSYCGLVVGPTDKLPDLELD